MEYHELNVNDKGVQTGQEPGIEWLLLWDLAGCSLRFFFGSNGVYCSTSGGGVMSSVWTSFALTTSYYWLVCWLLRSMTWSWLLRETRVLETEGTMVDPFRVSPVGSCNCLCVKMSLCENAPMRRWVCESVRCEDRPGENVRLLFNHCELS